MIQSVSVQLICARLHSVIMPDYIAYVMNHNCHNHNTIEARWRQWRLQGEASGPGLPSLVLPTFHPRLSFTYRDKIDLITVL